MSHLDPYHLAQLARHYWSGQPYGPAERIEPILGGPSNIREDPARARTGKSRGLDIFQMPQPPTTQAQKKAAAREQTAHDEGIKAVGDALRPGAIEPDASTEPTRALGAEAVDSGLDKELTKQWIDRMRAARESKKATPPADPRAGQAGEDAVARALRDIDMKPLIDHALTFQAIQSRIADLMRQLPPEGPAYPESSIPANINEVPGSNYSTYKLLDPNKLWQSQTVPGLSGTPPVIDPFRSSNVAGMPSSTNLNPPTGGLFPPQAPHDPNLPPGPHVRSPGKPEDEPPVVE